MLEDWGLVESSDVLEATRSTELTWLQTSAAQSPWVLVESLGEVLNLCIILLPQMGRAAMVPYMASGDNGSKDQMCNCDMKCAL